MLPVLVSLGPIKIYSMGVLLTIGLFLGLYYWWRLGRDEHWEEINLFDGFFLALTAFFVFGRLGYVAMHWNDLGTVYRLLAFLTYPGISYLAGIVGATLSVISYARAKEWETWKLLDIYAVTLSLTLVFGFVGALLNGSNPGIETQWGLVFPGASGRRFPVDLWGILWALVAFGTTVRIRKNFRFYTWYKGTASVAKDGLTALTLTSWGGIYLAVNSLVDDNLVKWGPVSYMLILGIIMTVSALYTIKERSGNPEKLSLLHFIRQRKQGGKS